LTCSRFVTSVRATLAKLELRDVTKRYGGVLAVDRLSLAIDDGELCVLLGPSGCGKTTVLRLIAGLLAPDGGEMLLAGRRISTPGFVMPPERRGMAMVFQSYALWPHMTVFDNIAYGLKLRGTPRPTIAQQVGEALRLVKLEGLDRRYPGELSGGQQQRVALARAVVVRPAMLLFDEPLSNLDALLRDQMRFELRELQRTVGITSVYVTHDQREALVLGDRIVVMRAGRIVQSGTPEAVVRRPVHPFVAEFLGTSNLLPGRLRELHRSRNRASVDLDHHVLEATLPDVTDELQPGRPVLVSVRPVDVRLEKAAPHEPGMNTIAGRVQQRTFLGDLFEYALAVADDLTLTVRTHPSVMWNPGDEVSAVFAADDATCLAVEE
jgi:iron(III) transport system ATP-binding protein